MGRVAATLLGAVGLIGLLAGAAWGHAFEVEHSPEHGARLAAAPARVELRFSEPVVRESVEVFLREAAGEPLPLGAPILAAEGRLVGISLAGLRDGIYLVNWQVVAASDGHVTAGEFAFAVGDIEGDVPASSSSAERLAVWPVVSGWALLAGLSLAAGALMVDRFLPLGEQQRRLVVPTIRAGLLAAIAGAAAQLLAPGGLATDAGTLWGSAPGVLTLLAVVVLALALPLASRPSGRRWALGLLASAAALWSARGHAAAYGGLWWGTVDFLHLAAAATWVGSLVVVAFVLWGGRKEGGPALLRLVAAYARVALGLVAVVVVTGITSAIGLLNGLADLYASGYGLVLVGKMALIVLVLVLALWGRLRALPRHRLASLRRIAGAESGLLAGVLVATAILTNLGPPVGAAAAADLLGPAPMRGPVARDAGLAGTLNVAVAAGDGRLRVQVFAPSGSIEGTEATVSAQLPGGRAATLHPRPCGQGCWEQDFALPRGSTSVTVDAGAPGREGGRFTGDLDWPPTLTRLELLRSVLRRMRAVPRLELREQVTSHSGREGPATSTSLTGREYVRLAPYAAGDVVDVRTVRGEDHAVEFALPASRMLFTLWLDDHGRVRREHIISPGHEIRRKLRYPAAVENGQPRD
ncbi:MAG: copper resistance protein CopC/CopD [Actinobacteria bacterium]|nr:copper resistance protein CopC/CopD [Actinomycetota bacterium]